MPLSAIVPSEELDKKLLQYILAITERGRSWWQHDLADTGLNRRSELQEYRLRMEGRRSVAELYHDAKNEPFEGASNIGVGLESIFSETLIPMLLANTHDLEPSVQAVHRQTREVSEDLTTFHDFYHRYEVANKRELLETSTRELLTVGSSFHKWTYDRTWKQTLHTLPVWLHPLTRQPILLPDPLSGRPMPLPADPKTPKERIPTDPLTGQPFVLGSLNGSESVLVREGPQLSVRPVEAMGWPERESRVDPDEWDWLSDDFEVSPYWFLGREGEPFHGKLRLKKLWRWLSITPETLYKEPMKLTPTLKPVKLRVFHGKYPAAQDGSPVEILALIAVDAKLLLGWQPSQLSRRPYFNRQVWSSQASPVGKGIPETVFALRAAMDALLNQDIDAGNLYNHPPLLVSDLAMVEDEDYETTGPGSSWILRDINGMKFLPPPISQRNPLELLNWLFTNGMRMWGVTDLTMNAPTHSLSPNVRTAHGVMQILNQGSIKFGHLTKRLAATDTLEYQFVHDSFREMLANPRLVPVNGKPVRLDASKKEAYFSDQIQLTAVGNGISTNPLVRQQVWTQFLSMAVKLQVPFLVGDLEAYKKAFDQWVSAFGLDIPSKEPQSLQQSRLFLELMQTPQGQQLLPATMQQVIQAVQQAQSGGTNGQATPPTPTLATR